MEESFYYWLLQFKSDDTAVGDFARNVEQDEYFSRRSKNYKYLRKYLESVGASDLVLGVFEEAFSHYQKKLTK